MITILPIMNSHKSINSPFRYAGGKFYARKLILGHIPKHSAYIEPFAGGGSIFFAKPKTDFNHLNDIDAEIINVYNVIKDFPDGLINFLKYNSNIEEQLPKEIRKNLNIGDSLPAQKKYIIFLSTILNQNRPLKKRADGFI